MQTKERGRSFVHRYGLLQNADAGGITIWTRDGIYTEGTYETIRERLETVLSRSVPLFTPEVYRRYEMLCAEQILHANVLRHSEGSPVWMADASYPILGLKDSDLFRYDREAFQAAMVVLSECENTRAKNVLITTDDGKSVGEFLYNANWYLRRHERDALQLACGRILKDNPVWDTKTNGVSEKRYTVVVRNYQADREEPMMWQRAFRGDALARYEKEYSKRASLYQAQVRDDFSPLVLTARHLMEQGITFPSVQIGRVAEMIREEDAVR